MKKIVPVLLALIMLVASACGGSDDASKYAVGGTITGLDGTIVMQNNATDDLTIVENGAFAFATPLAAGSEYLVTVKTQPAGQICTASNNSGTVFGANVTDVSVVCSAHADTYTIGGTITGLNGTVVLHNNVSDDLTISENGVFTFTTPVADGAGYAVTVKTQPAGQICTASNNSGTVSGANVTDVSVVCSAHADTYTIGGTITGLNGTVVLHNNVSDDLTITSNGTFTFTTPVADGAGYAVTVKTQPAGQICTASNNSGTVFGANVTTVSVVCSAHVDTYTIGGTITGLNGTVVLQNNATDDLSTTANGVFTFATPLADGAGYDVTVRTQPAGQTCIVSNNSGTVSGANVTNVSVVCSTHTYTIGGTISGLVGTVVLQNNATDDLSTTANGVFTFATPLADGAGYAVTVRTQPAGQTCIASNNSGTVSGANVTTVSVVCSAHTYTIGGTMTGLTGTVVLQNNATDDLSTTANGVFTFTTPLVDGAGYAVTVRTQPAGQTCIATNDSGTVSGANVTNVSVVCSATYTIGGTISGLVGTVVLQNNATDDLSTTANGVFTFATPLADGAGYDVTVRTEPAGQTCVASNNSGTVSGANVTTVSVVCSTQSYTIGGTVTGLTGTVVLQNNATDDLTIVADGAFTFATPLAYGTGYIVTVSTQPATQGCTISNGTGTVTANVTNVGVICEESQAKSAESVVAGDDNSNFYGVSVDSAGNTYAVGRIVETGIYDFGTAGASVEVDGAFAGDNAVIVKYNSAGVTQWAKSVAAGLDDSLFKDVSVDSSGNIYAVGHIVETDIYNFGVAGTPVEVDGAFAGDNTVIVKYNSAGVAQWAKSVIVGDQNSEFLGVSVDGAGNAYAVGYIYGTSVYDFGTAGSTSIEVQGVYAGGDNVVIVKYNSAGVAQWARSVTVANSDSVFQGVSVDSSGNAHAVGYISRDGTYNFGAGVEVQGACAVAPNVVIVKYNSAGVAQWVRSVIVGSSLSEFQEVSVDNSGNAYVAGYMYGTGIYDFGIVGASVEVQGTYVIANPVIVKYDSAGVAQWARTATVAIGNSVFYGVSVDGSGNAYAVGYMVGTGMFDFGIPGASVEVQGPFAVENAVIVKYDPAGVALWARSAIAGSNNFEFHGVSVDGAGNVDAVGFINGNEIYDFGMAGGTSVEVQGTFADNNVVIVKYQ